MSGPTEDEIYAAINRFTAIILDPATDREERNAAARKRRVAIELLEPEFRDGRPVITEAMAAKMDPFFPALAEQRGGTMNRKFANERTVRSNDRTYWPSSERENAQLMQSFRRWAELASYFARLANLCDARAIASIKKAKGIDP